LALAFTLGKYTSAKNIPSVSDHHQDISPKYFLKDLLMVGVLAQMIFLYIIK
jgi:hypothetical protein